MVVKRFLDQMKCEVTVDASGAGRGHAWHRTGAAAGARALSRFEALLMSSYSTELLEAERESPPEWEFL